MIPANTQQRLWAKVDKSGGPDACWPWRGDADPKGYGKIRVRYRRWFAHRLALCIMTGREPPASIYALHSCDNPGCVNPAHLRWGSAQDNTDDRMARSYRPGMYSSPGERNPRARLTEAQAKAIILDPRTGETVAAEYGVSKSTVNHLRAGRTWHHLHT